MAQNITLMGASYSAVPAVTLPKTGGGTASFTDVTDTTAVAADVASGKYFYTSAGVRTAGTNSGGGGNEFVVTLSWDDDYYSQGNGAWIPDCTINELQSAYEDEKEIAFIGENGEATYWFCDDDYAFVYGIYVGNDTLIEEYFFTTQGVAHTDELRYIFPNFESPSRTYTPTTSTQTETITYNPSDYNGIDHVSVTVNPMPSGTAGTPTATKGTVSNHSISVTPSVTNTTGYITGSTKTGTAVTVSASELVSGSQTITQNGTVNVTNLAEVVVSVEGGSGGMTVATATATPSSASASISFTGLSGEPTSFVVISSADLATGASPYKTAAVVFDGTDLHGQTITNTSNAQVSYDDTHFSKTYSNGTLTITGSTYWQANEYKLVYTYGGSSANIDTADVQVGSGATSITFTGLTDEPDYFSCIFKSNFSSSSGYQRVIAVVYDGNSTYGLAMDSGAKAESSWSYTYNNGSLTISSQGTNNGGYFHQPGYYQLTYGIGGTVEPTEIEVEPLSVTQNGTYTAPTGKAYSPVTVNISGGGGVNIDTKSVTNSSNQNTSISFSSMKGQPKAFFARCTATLSRSSSNTYYYVADMVYDGTSTVGNMHARSNGQYSNITSGYSWSYSGTTLTLTSSGARNTSPGSFYNGTYELVYIY